MEWVYLGLAIVLEIISTSLLKISEGLTKLIPSSFMFLSLFLSFWFFSKSLEKIPVSIAYAIWAAAGITLISIAGLIFFKEDFCIIKVISIAFIIIGVVGLTLKS